MILTTYRFFFDVYKPGVEYLLRNVYLVWKRRIVEDFAFRTLLFSIYDDTHRQTEKERERGGWKEQDSEIMGNVFLSNLSEGELGEKDLAEWM